jgi:hypothetical protein
MLLISHRGNLNGPIPEKENTQKYIQEAIKAGFDVEVDVWEKDGSLWLGHDKPIEIANSNFLRKHKKSLWLHCKNLGAAKLIAHHGFNMFLHETDPYVFTSNGFLWTYPDKETCQYSILVVLKKEDNLLYKSRIEKNEIQVRGICTDYPTLYLT